MKKKFSKITIIALIICAIITILLTVFEIEMEKKFEIIFSTYTIATYVILTEHGLATYNKPKLKYLAIFSFIVNTIGCLLYLGLIWGIIELCLFSCKNGNDSEFLIKLLATTSILSILTSIVSKTLEIENNNPKIVSLKNTLFTLGTILAIAYLEQTWLNIISEIIDYELYSKILFILTVAFVLLIIIIPIYNSVSKNKEQNETPTNTNNTIINELPNIIKKKCSICNYDLEDTWNYCLICSTKKEQTKNNLE